jgi:hypothetical protein
VVAKGEDDDGTYTSGATRFCHNYKPINENIELKEKERKKDYTGSACVG